MIQTVEVDECVGCGGTWFERDELRQAKDQTDPDLNWMDFELWKNPDLLHVSSIPIRCPECQVDMVAINYDKTGIAVDVCTQCQGSWLDADEFRKIIDSLYRELETKGKLEYLRASLEQAKEIVTGPESLASEWRDFLTVVRLFHYRVLIDNPKLSIALASIQKNIPIR